MANGILVVDQIAERTTGNDIKLVDKAQGVDPTASNHLATKNYVDNITHNATQIQGNDVSSSSPASNDLLIFNSTSGDWEPGQLSGVDTSNGAVYFNDNLTVTTIATIDTPVKVNATYASEFLSDFSHVGGKLTYTGATTKKFIIHASGSLYIDGANEKRVSFYIGTNGVVTAKTKRTFSSGVELDGVAFASIAVIELSTNDYIELFVENNEATQDVIVTNLYNLISEL